VQCLIDGDCTTGTRCVNNTCQVPSTCRNSLDCATGQYPVCDTGTGQCVQCVVPNDCPDNNDCINQGCVPYVPCSSSLDCPNRQVCETTIGRCVECIVQADCGDTRTCVGNACRIRCESDNQCTPLGLLCSANIGYCAECLRDENCVQSRWCSTGVCVPDVCTPGAQRCQNNAVETCNAAGSGWTSAACSAYQTCKDTNGTPACHDWLCTPNTSQCDQGTERVMQCSADGLAQAVIQDCGTQVCVAATCKPVICTAGTRSCASNIVYQCSPKGDAQTVYDTCTSAEYCDDATRTCQTKICTPNTAACDGNVATTCNSIGSGYTGTRTDCGTTSQPFCVAGACSTQLCSPNALFCENGVVRQCAVDGLSATLYQTCTTSQYCDDATATCKPKICTPNQPACNGNATTTCNALGSGYLDAGTPCGSLYCVSGTCQTALFAEDFEDGDYAGWTEGVLTGFTRTITTATAANGTTRSLQLAKTTAVSGGYDGIYRTFSALQPTNISWYSRTTTSTATGANYAPYITLGSSTAASNALLSHYIYRTSGSVTTGTMYLSAGGSCSSVTITTGININTWYLIEFRNINWSTRTFDYYVDGVQRPAAGTSCTFQNTGTSVSRLDLSVYSSNTTGLVDEIVFR
jgi:hypothetical protein